MRVRRRLLRPLGRTEGTVAQVADPHRDLRGQRARHGLSEGYTVEEVLTVHPLALFDQVTLHVASCGDRSTEPDRA